jgi:hypothetical protein
MLVQVFYQKSVLAHKDSIGVEKILGFRGKVNVKKITAFALFPITPGFAFKKHKNLIR